MSKTLRLTPFERCMLFDDRPSYPCHCFVRFRFEGKLHRETFEMALDAALKHHPLLRATVQTGWTWHWVVSDHVQPKLSWSHSETSESLPSADEIDLSRETGLSIFVVQDVANVDVTFQFHHACCDGAGLERFTEDLMVHYACIRENGESEIEVAPVDLTRLASRGSYGLHFLRTIRLLPSQLVGLLGAAQFWGRRPKPLFNHLPRDPDAKPNSHFPTQRGFRFDRSHTLALRQAANRQNVSLNDLLVRDFFLTLWAWQKEYDEYSDQDWVRLMIPMNMRDASYRSLPAMNYVSSIFLDRRGSEGGDIERLLQSIHGEMAVIKKFRLRYTFLLFLQMLNWVPGGLKRSVQRDQCKTSAIFSNTGKMTRRWPLPRKNGYLQVADLVLVDFDGLAPIRPYNCVTMLTHEYAHRLKLNLHYDADFVREEQADSLMSLFVARLHQTCGTSPCHAQV